MAVKNCRGSQKLSWQPSRFTTYPGWRGKDPEQKGNIVKARKMIFLFHVAIYVMIIDWYSNCWSPEIIITQIISFSWMRMNFSLFINTRFTVQASQWKHRHSRHYALSFKALTLLSSNALSVNFSFHFQMA